MLGKRVQIFSHQDDRQVHSVQEGDGSVGWSAWLVWQCLEGEQQRSQ